MTYKAAQHKPKTFEKSNIGQVEWVRCGENCMLQIYLLNDGKFVRFDGFKPKEKEGLIDLFQTKYGIELSESKLSTYALNVGNIELGNQKKTLELKFEELTVLDVPFNTISQCALPNKNEVEIQFEDDDTADSIFL